MIYNENGEIVLSENKSDPKINDLYIEGDPVRYINITSNQWNKNKNFYEKAIEIFNSKCNSILNKIPDNIINFYKNKKINIKVYSINRDYMTLSANDDSIKLSIPFEILDPKVNFKIKIELEFNKNYEFKYNWCPE